MVIRTQMGLSAIFEGVWNTTTLKSNNTITNSNTSPKNRPPVTTKDSRVTTEIFTYPGVSNCWLTNSMFFLPLLKNSTRTQRISTYFSIFFQIFRYFRLLLHVCSCVHEAHRWPVFRACVAVCDCSCLFSGPCVFVLLFFCVIA